MTQTPVSNLQPAVAMTEFVNRQGVFPSRDSLTAGAFLGDIEIFAGGNLFGDTASGQILPIQQNTALFSLMGTNYGGDGRSNFALPNLDGVETIGVGQGPGLPDNVIGENLGSVSNNLTKAQLPSTLGGTSQPIDNMQPSLAVTYCINAVGVYPTNGLTLDSIGVISAFAGNFAPTGMACNGQLLQISQYVALFNLIGTTYGGDGVNTFALPNLNGRDIVGAGAPGEVVGQDVGTLDDNLTSANSPLGADQPINNEQPGLVMNYYIATQGIFPSNPSPGTDQSAPFLGQIIAYAGTLNGPTGCLPCEGQILSIQQNQALFSLIGTTYGGDGRTTFALPDLRGKTVIGANSQDPLGSLSGSATTTLTSSNLPPLSAPTITLHSDTGVSNSDGITSNGQVDVSGLATGATWYYSINGGQSFTAGTGTSFTVTGDGAKYVLVKQSWGSGDVSPAASLSFTLITTPPSVGSITRVGSSPNNANSEQFTVTFSEVVTGVAASDFNITTSNSPGGTALTTGGITSVTGSGATYTVTVGGVAGDGTLRLDLKSGDSGITDLAGNSATAAFTSGAAYTIEQTPPSATSAAAPAGGFYGVGQVLTFTVTFSEPVNVDTTGGTPRIAINLATGGTAYANYVSGAGLNTLTFQYLVAAGQQALNGITTGASIDLNGGTLKDAAGNDAILTISGVEPSTAGIDINTFAPTETVALFAQTQSSLDALPTGFIVQDTAANLSIGLDLLNADAHINSIHATDASPVLVLTAAQAANDAHALQLISNASYLVRVVDTAANLMALTAAQITALGAEHVVAMKATDTNVNFGPTQGDALRAAAIRVVAPSGFHVREAYSDGSANNWFFGPNGVVTKLRVVHADGSVDVLVNGPGTFHGVAYAQTDAHATPAAFHDLTTYRDGLGDTVLTTTYTSMGGGQIQANTVNPDGTYELQTTGVTGQAYSAFSNDFAVGGALLARSVDNLDGSGKVRLTGSNLVVSVAKQTIGQTTAPSEFDFNQHASEQYVFVSGSNDRINFDAAGFGAATVSGFGVAGTNDIVDVSHLFGSFAAAQGAMTQQNGYVLITEGTDTIALIGAQKTSLTATQLGF